MKLIIAGSRHFTNITRYDIEKYINFFNIEDITEIISGGASGVDNAASWYAKENNILFTLFSADWHKYGKVAGPIRNEEMALYGDELLLIWDGKSRGSRNMHMKMIGKPTHEVILRSSK